MRVHGKPLQEDESEMWYVQDLPDGRILVSCNYCKAETTQKDKCSGCGKFFVYRPWLEW